MKPKTDKDIINADVDKNPANRDPLTGEPGSHPVGTGLGTAGAGTAGAVIGGAVGGPIGAAVGAVIGGVAGGLAGKGVAEEVNPTVEDTYWRENYTTRPYYDSSVAYDVYQPAYKHGWEASTRYAGKGYDEIEPDLERDWNTGSYSANLPWSRAKFATRDAFDRISASRKK